MSESIFPKIDIINPRQYLEPRIKRGAAFISAVLKAGGVTESCLTEYPHTSSTEAARVEASDY